MANHSKTAQPPHRYDPYANFKFRLKWDGRTVAGVSKVSALTRATQVISHRAGGDPATPQRMPSQSASTAVTLERGVTHDVAFEQWANKVWDYHNAMTPDQPGGDANLSLADFRKDLVLEVYNEAGQKVLAYMIYNCWPSEFVALPEMDGNGNAIAIQTLVLQNEGWERDTSVAEPDEPSFTLPPN